MDKVQHSAGALPDFPDLVEKLAGTDCGSVHL